MTGAHLVGPDRPMPSATAGITMINFGMGSPNAAIVMDLLSAIMPKAVLFLGKCGGLVRWPTNNRSLEARDLRVENVPVSPHVSDLTLTNQGRRIVTMALMLR